VTIRLASTRLTSREQVRCDIDLSPPPAFGELSVRKSIKGYNLVNWSEDGVDYWAACDLNAGELETFARLFRSALSGR
jgi:anti-sigma factor RsiW